jgi:hypothetical protein
MDALHAAFESLSARADLSFEQFEAFAAGCDIHPVCVDGDIVGAVIVKGPDIHACILSQARGRWFSRRCALILNDVIARHGFARTSATTQEGMEFVMRLGFRPSGRDWLKEDPYGH